MSQVSINNLEQAVIRRANEYTTALLFKLANELELKEKLIRNTNLLFLLKDAPECIDTSKLECNEL